MSRPARIRRSAPALIASALVLGLAAPVALAAPDDDLAAARATEAAVAGSVAGLEVELARLSTIADEAWARSATAGEDFLTAQVALDAAQDAADAAGTRLLAARETMESSRRVLAGIALERYRSGGSIQNLEAVLSADGITDVVRRAASLRTVGDAADAAVQQFRADTLVADVLQEDATSALAAAQSAATAATKARENTDVLTQAAQDAVDAAETRRDTLISQLAAARRTTVAAERERQDRIDRERDLRREEQAQEEREAAEDEPDAPGSEPSSRPTSRPTSTPTQAPTTEPTTRPTREPAAPTTTEPATPTTTEPAAPETTEPAPRPTTEPAAEPTSRPTTTPPAPQPTKDPAPPAPAAPGLGTGTAVGSAAQGRAAVAWARTQIGKMYGWGATGPTLYDCSGLTMRAWESAGVGITRTSRSQYVRVKKIAYSSMRPGDLIFWANNTSDPGTIRHVAMYTGGGMMIEAPRPGFPVREVPVRYAETMAYAGRP